MVQMQAELRQIDLDWERERQKHLILPGTEREPWTPSGKTANVVCVLGSSSYWA